VDSGDDRYTTLVRVVIGRSSRVAVLTDSLAASAEKTARLVLPPFWNASKIWLVACFGRAESSYRFLERFQVAPTIDFRAALDARFPANLY
jgi:hypothetical protein